MQALAAQGFFFLTYLTEQDEGFSEQKIRPTPENNDPGPSTSREKSNAEDPQPSGTGDDDEARLNSDLVTIWTQRLQVLTVVTSFLASMDGQLFSLSALNTQIGLPISSTSREIVYSCLAGALIFHICGALLSYIASFALVRYRVIEAIGEEEEAKRQPRKVVAEPLHPLQLFVTALQYLDRFHLGSDSQSSRSTPPPPLSLLTRCFFTTLALSALGFLSAIIGILAYVWSGLPVVVGISSTVCLGVGISATLWAIAM